MLGEIFERLSLPAVAGEILAGMLLGPFALAWIPANNTLAIFVPEASSDSLIIDFPTKLPELTETSRTKWVHFQFAHHLLCLS
jgi:hypothetical protein